MVVLELVVFAGLGKMSEVETELLDEGVGGLGHLDSLNLRLGLGAGGELEGLELAEHVHVSLELELGGSDDLLLGLLDGFGLKGHADLGVLLLDLLALLLVFHVLSDGELVVLGLELNPLACLLGDVDEGLLVLDLAFTESGDVFLLVLLTEADEFLLVKLSTLGSETAASLSGDDGSEDEEILVLKGAVDSGVEVTVKVHSSAHGKLRVVVLFFSIGGFLASPKVAQHSVVLVCEVV